MPKLNVILRKEDLNTDFLHDKVVVVIDVLFATSTIVTALHHGASAVLPHCNAQQAGNAARELDEGSYLLAGESHLNSIPGFAGYSPLSLAKQPLQGRQLIYCTTNGTVALRKADCARHVYAAALLNGPAIVHHLQQHTDLSLVFVCAGSAGRVNLEDLYTAGYLIEQLEKCSPNHWQHSDTSTIARSLYSQYAQAPLACLLDSQLGRSLPDDLQAEVRYAAQVGLFDVIPKLDGQRLVAA